MTGPSESDPRPRDAAPIALAIEADPPPVIRALAADLAVRLEDAAFAGLTSRARGTVSLSDADTPQAAVIRLDGQRVHLTHGFADDADIRATVALHGGAEPVLEGETEDPELADWLRQMLAAPPVPWPEAAARFWSVLAPMPGAPEALLVVATDCAEERRFGAPNARAYELHGGADGLTAVLCGRVPLVDAAFAGSVFVRGSFPELSVLSGAGFRIRYGGLDDESADA